MAAVLLPSHMFCGLNTPCGDEAFVEPVVARGRCESA